MKDVLVQQKSSSKLAACADREKSNAENADIVQNNSYGKQPSRMKNRSRDSLV